MSRFGRRAALAHEVTALKQRVAELEAEVHDARALHRRLADVVDVVTELLVPAMDRDDAKVREALESFGKVVG